MRSWAMGALALTGLALTGLALGGCAPTAWTKSGASAEDRDAALDACEDYADDYLQDDFATRMEDTRRGVATGEDESDLLTDFRRYDERSRRTGLVASCMRQNGYSLEEDQDTGGEDAGAADDAS
jgi:hypothetical protein